MLNPKLAAQVLADGSYSIGPRELAADASTARVEHCLVRDAEHRARVVFNLKRLGADNAWRVLTTEVLQGLGPPPPTHVHTHTHIYTPLLSPCFNFLWKPCAKRPQRLYFVCRWNLNPKSTLQN